MFLSIPLRLPKRPVKVKIIIEEDNEAVGLKISSFSFAETQNSLKNRHPSFTDEVIEERRREL